MPPRLFYILSKRRNVRSIIFLLILATLLFGLYQLLLGKSWNATTPSYFVPIPMGELPANHKSHYVTQGLPERDEGGESKDQSPLLPKYNSAFGNKYERGDSGRCPKLQIFKPDIDVTEIYPRLDFDGDWISSKEYWNPEFETRYKNIQESEKTPPLKVFVVPHSHNDPGWLKTYEQYYTDSTRHILDNIVEQMTELKNMTFIWSEISFLSKWWDEAHSRKRKLLRKLVKEGRLEIVTGGWVMTDEATVTLFSMIDQLVEGHQWMKTHLNVKPTSSWSVDPFGHGSTFPYVLKKAGLTGMVVQRIHYGWKKWFMVQQKSDFQWVQRFDHENRDGIRCHNRPFDIYSTKHSCGPRPMVCLNFDFRNVPGEHYESYSVMQPITEDNVQYKAELMLEQYRKTASLFPHNMAFISLGDDFGFKFDLEWGQQYHNYMKLFNYINAHKDKYKAEVNFGTVSDYFKALDEREYAFPTLSGDFHVYSDIFSDGRPAYWSGYYGTRPFWKKFYRETENSVRGAEILFSFANAVANQHKIIQSQKILTRAYQELTIARRWLALFAHHDASTGTSKAATMLDYGEKLMEARKLSKKVQMYCIATLLYGKAEEDDSLSTPEQLGAFGEQPRQIPISFNASGIKKVVVYNSLGRRRYEIVTLVLNTPHVEVIGPSGEFVEAQINPVLEVTKRHEPMKLSSEMFELSFLANLAPLSLSIYQVRKSRPDGENNVGLAAIFCENCRSLQNIFRTSPLEDGDIQLSNDKVQILFNKDTGMLMEFSNLQQKVSTSMNFEFGQYEGASFRSGAYLLMTVANSEQKFPFIEKHPQLIIVSGQVYSELSVFRAPLIMSTRIMHAGDNRMLEAVFLQNQLDVGMNNGEFFMRVDTDIRSVSKVDVPKVSVKNKTPNGSGTLSEEDPPEDDSIQPTFYTDQAGFTVEKRVKIPAINYEGNNYPVNTMAFLQDEARKLRFSILVDRAHGFSSDKTGRLETLVERRGTYDDSRGMGEGVADNKLTISNYILLLEKIGHDDKVRHRERDYRTSQPTLPALHHSQELSYPAFVYFINEPKGAPPRENVITKNSPEIYPLLTQDMPCDSHLINLRTMEDANYDPDLSFPGKQALLIVQKLGYLCTSTEDKPGCGNPNPASLFYPETTLNGVTVKSLTSSNLVGFGDEENKRNFSNLHEVVGEPFEIASLVVTFN